MSDLGKVVQVAAGAGVHSEDAAELHHRDRQLVPLASTHGTYSTCTRIMFFIWSNVLQVDKRDDAPRL